jgi:outer membrane lipoprotein-sorting protein
MSTPPNIDEQLNEIGQTLQEQPSVHGAVMRRVTEASLSPAPAAAPSWRRTMGRVAAMAACAAIVLALWSTRGGGPLGAAEAFAAAIANVDKAKTFSAQATSRSFDKDGKERVSVTITMYKEPSRLRMEDNPGTAEHRITIRDYAAQRELYLQTKEKTAALSDTSDHYSVDRKTGKTQLTKLEMYSRDDVAKLTARAVTEVGVEKIDGREVRVLRSADPGKPVITVWADRKTGKPVKIEVASTEDKSTFTYSSIVIDEPMDDALFSLNPPAGYAVTEYPDKTKPDPLGKDGRAHYGKMMTKIKTIMNECYNYMNEHEGAFPDKLTDLTKTGMSEAAVKALLASPDEPEGPPVVEYRKPKSVNEPSETIVVYEAEKFRRKGYVAAGMMDGHAELLTTEEFEKRMK